MDAFRRGIAIATALVALAVLVALFQTVRRFEPALPASAGPGVEDSSLRAENATMVARWRGQAQWKLRVARIGLRRLPDADLTEFHLATFHRVQEGVIYDDGAPRARFEADQAVYDKALKRLEVKGRIRLTTTDGDVFASERCVWTERDEFARFPDGATVTIKGDRVIAPLMLYATRQHLVQCPQGASAVFRGQALQAAGLEWDVDGGKIRCRGPVSGRRGKLEFLAEFAELDLKSRVIRVNKAEVQLRMDEQ